MVVCNKCGAQIRLADYVDIGFCPECGAVGYVNDVKKQQYDRRW